MNVKYNSICNLLTIIRLYVVTKGSKLIQGKNDTEANKFLFSQMDTLEKIKPSLGSDHTKEKGFEICKSFALSAFSSLTLMRGVRRSTLAEASIHRLRVPSPEASSVSICSAIRLASRLRSPLKVVGGL